MRGASADPPGLVHSPPPVLTRVERVDEKADLAGTGSGLDLVGAVDEVAGARLHAEAVERGLAERMLDPFAEIGGHVHAVGFERSLEGGLELALGVGGVELGARNADPGAAAGSAGADVGCDFALRGEREPDQFLLRRLTASEDAGAFGFAPLPFTGGAGGGPTPHSPPACGRGGFSYARSGIIPRVPHRRPPRLKASTLRPRTSGRGQP